MTGPIHSCVQFCRRVIRQSVLRAWVLLELALPLIVLSSLLHCAQADDRSASTKSVPQSQSVPHPIRLPVVDANDIRFSRLSTARGLSQTRVQQIVEDNQGFIWFGTQYGLDRYDGYEYKVFTHDPGRENSLSCVLIHSVFKDRSGTLWVGCDDVLDRLDAVKDTFTHYRIGEAGAFASAVIQISQDRTGLLWLATGQQRSQMHPRR
jgi:ligand-binding sensor domain-containing protein